VNDAHGGVDRLEDGVRCPNKFADTEILWAFVKTKADVDFVDETQAMLSIEHVMGYNDVLPVIEN
jgi:hypothetical protein